MIVDGKKIATHIEEKIVYGLLGHAKRQICFILFGDNKASRQFITMKTRVANRLDIAVTTLEYRDDIKTEEAINKVRQAVEHNFDGIVIQLPLPQGFDTEAVLNSVPAQLDIDVLSTSAKEAYKTNLSGKIPPVARAVMEILEFYNVSLVDKEILVIGNGKLVGEPVSSMLTMKNIPFTIIDKNTETSENVSRIASADIIISGAGVPFFIKPEMIKSGVILIDAGTSEYNGTLVGDVDPTCIQKASLVTPVPGGVGPITVASLFLNIL